MEVQGRGRGRGKQRQTPYRKLSATKKRWKGPVSSSLHAYAYAYPSRPELRCSHLTLQRNAEQLIGFLEPNFQNSIRTASRLFLK